MMFAIGLGIVIAGIVVVFTVLTGAVHYADKWSERP